MLVLSRKETERIRLGKSIVVTVVRVSGDKVRLGIEAPPDVLVLREELEPHEQPRAGRGKPVAAAVETLLADALPVIPGVTTAVPGMTATGGPTTDLPGPAVEVVTEFEVELTSGVTLEFPV